LRHHRRVQRVATPAELAGDPLGNYWQGETMLVWCHDPRTCGTFHWGSPHERDVRELITALDLSRHPALADGFDVFMDTSAIEAVDWTSFSLLAGHVREQLAAWAKVIRRHAVIVPTGPVAPLLAGMVPLIGMTYPLRFFSARDAAIDWLERRDAIAAIEEAAELATSARRLSPLVHRLRAWLETALDATLEDAAIAFAVSTRSLQRDLRAAATSFTAELQSARIRIATRRLVETDDKIEAIARDVGCVSSSQLSTLFRKHVGETPARFRERLRSTK
jgi:AraC-like DNA-binding protein